MRTKISCAIVIIYMRWAKEWIVKPFVVIMNVDAFQWISQSLDNVKDSLQIVLLIRVLRES